MEIYQHARKQMKIEKPEFGYSVNDITSFLQESNLNELKKKLQQSKKRITVILDYLEGLLVLIFYCR